VRFSLIYPTRHRPAFVRQALRFLARQRYQNFEVVVCDNYFDAALSCEAECQNSPLSNIKYVKAPRPLGMAANWNYALRYASGEYVCYFTDKMCLLPDTLSSANSCIETTGAEIVNWVDNSYFPKRFPEYFGEGTYVLGRSSAPMGADFCAYDPQKELSRRGRAEVSRGEQDRSAYVRGKICFGAYRADLCSRIVEKTGALFHEVSPDYTSMILGLCLASSAAELSEPGIVHIETDLSNGALASLRDDLAMKFLIDLGDTARILSELLVPGLYSASHNLVAHDYVTLSRKFGLNFDFDRIAWLVYITEDLDTEGRQWSSLQVQTSQRRLLKDFIEQLPSNDRLRYGDLLTRRRRLRKGASRSVYARDVMKTLLPAFAVRTSRRLLRRPEPKPCSSIEDIVARTPNGPHLV
jgi:glycosyltransferase involved in cell wall biosynthesis